MIKPNMSRSERHNGIVVGTELLLGIAALAGIGAHVVGRAPRSGEVKPQPTATAGRLTEQQVISMYPKGGEQADPANSNIRLLVGVNGTESAVFYSDTYGQYWTPVPTAPQATEVGATQVVSVSIAPESDLGPNQPETFGVDYSNPSKTEAVVAAYQASPDGSVDLVASAAGNMVLDGANGTWEREQDGSLYFTENAAKGGPGQLQDLGVSIAPTIANKP